MSPATAAAQMVFGAGFSSGLGSAGFSCPKIVVVPPAKASAITAVNLQNVVIIGRT